MRLTEALVFVFEGRCITSASQMNETPHDGRDYVRLMVSAGGLVWFHRVNGRGTTRDSDWRFSAEDAKADDWEVI